jgi:VWFA-related protein
MRRPRIGLGFLIFLTGILLTGSQAARSQPPGSTPRDVPVFGETIDVRVVNVEVVVTGEDGQPVRGLAPADFRLLVDGGEVSLDYFSEIVEGRAAPSSPAPPDAPGGPVAPVAPAEAVPRSYLVFIDDSFSVASPRNEALQRLAADLSLLGPEDRMAVLAFDGKRIEVLSPWSAGRAALTEALKKARDRPARGNQMISTQRSLEEDEDISMEAAWSMELTRKEREGMMDTLKKRVNPEARTQLGRTAQAMAGAVRGFEAPPGRKVMLLLSGGWSLTVAPMLFGPLVESANRLGYTLYPMDVAQGDARILRGLDQLAAATGGKVANSVDQNVLRTVAADSGSYYWLGFSPAWKGNDLTHDVQVEVRRPGLKVRARRGFSDLSPRTEVAFKAESLLLFGGGGEDRRVRVELGAAQPVGRRSREVEVPVTLGVPVEALALKPVDGGGYVAEVPLAIAAVDAKEGRSELPVLLLRIAVEQPPPAGGYARFRTVLRLRRLSQRLVFTVRDATSGKVLWGEAQLSP